jgi:hypothetical protein
MIFTSDTPKFHYQWVNSQKLVCEIPLKSDMTSHSHVGLRQAQWPQLWRNFSGLLENEGAVDRFI